MSNLEELQQAVTQLTGAVNAQIEISRKLEMRLSLLEATSLPLESTSPEHLAVPKTEQDLKDISTLPDSVKELQIFDGNPTQYVSWIHNVETILKDYKIVRNKPIYRAILQSIRQKIRGSADAALIAYNLFDEDWATIKQCLSLHYADKRDLRTLEHQLSTMVQRNLSLDEFYARVNHQFSLIVNKIKTENYSMETVKVLVETYRNRALDVFTRGLNGDLSKMLMIQRPQTLPEAYTSCLEILNTNYRGLYVHKKDYNTTVTTPVNQISPPMWERKQYTPRKATISLPPQQKIAAYNIQHQFHNRPPPRPAQPKPPVPMEVDQSMQTRRINYMNRPYQEPIGKRPNESESIPPQKQQRIYHLETDMEEPGKVNDDPYNDDEDYGYVIKEEYEEDNEINFMTDDLSSIPYIEYKTREGKVLKFLIDTGTNKNFIKPELATKTTPTNTPFKIKSAGGDIKIKEKVTGKFFKSIGIETKIDFFVLPGLKTFDGIIGDDTLKNLEAVIDRKNNILRLKSNIKIPLKEKQSIQINIIEIRDNHLKGNSKEKVNNLVKQFKHLFGPISDQETIGTNIKAEIKTTTEEPIYTKTYPYPVNMRTEVEAQIKKLLEDGIIRPSKSPYNSLIWIVEKKLDASGEKKYRMVIDFKRLNAVTISDTYPIPDISTTIASLENSKYFTTLDLTSGFHQIKMKETDIPKTAFSTMNGKYEFTSLPFGLKNAPAIFQRMIDDVLKEFIGKICYVYIDDIIIFGGKNEDEHLNNVERIFKKLERANLRVNLDKTEFLKTKTEFLGYVITNKGIKPDPKKIAAIQNIKPPQNLKELKSFLGLTSYYRRFIKDYAKIAKPLTNLTRGATAQVKARQSKKIPIKLEEKEIKAFKTLKTLLSSPEILTFPDLNKPFILTTDASQYAIGAVLSQGEIGKDRPITYISRSLNRTEESYATNEKEMLAIVWALDNLRNYLYGAKKVKILTDHQPLTFALSNRNNNAKLKRWKAKIEEYNHELIYKPGSTNKVADALSRLELEANLLTSSATIHSAEEDNTDLIPHCEVPINAFRNQIIIQEGNEANTCQEPHPTYYRHQMNLPEINKRKLIKVLKEYLKPSIINGIKIPEKYLQLLQEVYKSHFRNYKIRITQRIVKDVNTEEEKHRIIQKEHARAHRNHKENKEQILENYYFPHMASTIKKYTQNCEVCHTNKYDRHPNKPEIQQTPIPTYPSEILHMDIIEIKKEKFITCVDKFSKFAKFFRIKDKTVLHLRDKITKIIHYFTIPRMIIMDNERSFISPIITDYIKTLGIEIYLTPTQRSEVNGIVERVHSTIVEIVRCLQEEDTLKELTLKELVNIAVDRYNNTIHSVTNKKPSDTFFNRSQRINYQGLINFKDKMNEDVPARIKRNQKNKISRENIKKTKTKTYTAGEIIYVAVKQIQGKHKPKFVKETVVKDNKVTVVTASGRRIHKSQIKNISK